MGKTDEVRCRSCGTLFGIADDDGRIAIKHRDLFRIIRGSVEGPCRRCGEIVRWLSPDHEEGPGTA
jgi:hypothetical protein